MSRWRDVARCGEMARDGARRRETWARCVNNFSTLGVAGLHDAVEGTGEARARFVLTHQMTPPRLT
jgi:hypothetical protein